MRALLVYAHINNPNPFPPMGIVYLGTFLKKHGIDVKLVDLTFSKSYKDFSDELKLYSPDVVGVSVLTVTYNYSKEIARITKEHNPKCTVIYGGPHVTALPQEVMKNKDVDIAVMGEGELTLLEIMEYLSDRKDTSAIKGIYYRLQDDIIFTGPRPFIENLDQIGIPDRTLLPTFAAYLKFPIIYPYPMPWTMLIVSRGCPFNCAFCQPLLDKIFGRKVRLRSPESVADEIEQLVGNYKLRSFYFTDDTFLANKEWAQDVCSEIIKRKINKRIVWGCQTNINTFSEKIAYSLKQAGCIFLQFGVESGNDYVLHKILNKNQTVEKIKEAFQICKKTGFLTEANLIIGNPGETEEMARDTLALVKELRPDVIDTHFLTPTPGSQLYEKYSSEGLLKYESWESPDRYTAGLIKNSLPDQTLSKLYNEIYETFLKTRSVFRIKKHWFKWFISVVPNIFTSGRPVYFLRFLINCIAQQDFRLYRLLNKFKKAIMSVKRILT